MNIYFLSPVHATLKIENQAFYLTPLNPQILQTEKSNLFVELIPRGNYLNGYGNVFKSETCKNLQIIDLFGDVLVVLTLKQAPLTTYEKLFSETFNVFGQPLSINCLVDGYYKLTLSSAYYYEQAKLPFKPKSLKWQVFDGEILLVILEGEQTALLAYTIPNFELCFSKICNEFKISSCLETVNYYSTVLKHKVISTWQIGKPFNFLGAKTICQTKKVEKHLLEFAFLEEVAFLGDYQRFLGENLAENEKLIPSFIGKFNLILPPICPQKPNSFVLIDEQKAKFINFEITNEKITDLNIQRC